ncbi:MAG: DUF4423 domain-containing protein [Bacteriovoracia bacterium]
MRKPKPIPPRPDIFHYTSAATFLKAWTDYRRAKDRSYSARAVARALGYSMGYFALVFNRQRKLPAELLEKMLPHLGLAEHEVSYLRTLREKDEQDTLAGDQEFVQKAQRSKRYRRLNPREYEVYRYMSQWLCVVIREMVELRQKPHNIEEIQNFLIFETRRDEIRNALDFLIRNGFVEKAGDGTLRLINEHLIECRGDVYRLALARYHQSMLNRAIDAIEVAPRERRTLEGLTVGLSEAQYEKAQAILVGAIDQVMAMAQEPSAKESVYHLGVLAYPITRLTPKP